MFIMILTNNLNCIHFVSFTFSPFALAVEGRTSGSVFLIAVWIIPSSKLILLELLLEKLKFGFIIKKLKSKS